MRNLKPENMGSNLTIERDVATKTHNKAQKKLGTAFLPSVLSRNSFCEGGSFGGGVPDFRMVFFIGNEILLMLWIFNICEVAKE